MDVIGLSHVLLICLLPAGVQGVLDCFSCIKIHHIEDCHAVTTCATSTERCYTDVTGQPGNLTYALGCREAAQCVTSATNATNATSDVDCHECCDIAGCNKALCTSALIDPSANCTAPCDDDPSFDCQHVDQVFGVCHDIHHAKGVCRKFCGLCCLVDGAWADWAAWGDCSVTCNNGSQTRVRTCDNPRPQNGGLFCEGGSKDSKPCTREACPVHGQWSAWDDWSACNVSCGMGITKRHRKCDNPPPSRSGNHCFGDGVDFNVCATTSCGTDGGWTDWSSWQSCSTTCGTGLTKRRRQCSNPPPADGGRTCTGDAHEYQLCNTHVCPPSGLIYTEWTTWYPCTDNIQFRNRTCYLYGDVVSRVKCQKDKDIEFRGCSTAGTTTPVPTPTS